MKGIEEKLNAAIEAVGKACRVCGRIQGALSRDGILNKDDGSPVTVADFASQAVVCGFLGQAFKERAVIVAEEGADALRSPENSGILDAVLGAVQKEMQHVTAEKVLEWIQVGGGDAVDDGFWTLDPIDGTKGFLRGDQYAVALAYIEKGMPVLGVLGCPNLDIGDRKGAIFAAARGESCEMYSVFPEAGERDGAYAHLRTVRAPVKTDSARARFCESVEKAHTNQSVSARIAAVAGLSPEPYRIDSQCKYAVVAMGEACLYLRVPTKRGYREKIWDHAAGALVVECAGGMVTDLDGKRLDFSTGCRLEQNRGVVATSGSIHSRVLDGVRVSP